MTNRELCEYLFTQDPDSEVTVRVESFFDGVKIMKIVDVEDTELQVEVRNKL